MALALILAACFRDLLQNPTFILVDPDHPSVDHAIRGRPRDLGNDLTHYYLPRLLWLQHAIKATGRPCFWDPSGFGGRPLVGNPQAGLFYPPVWPILWFGSPSALVWLTLGHLFIGSLGTYSYARTLDISEIGSILAATIFVAGPYMLGHVYEGHYPHVWSACWYPWVFLFYEKAVNGHRTSMLGFTMTMTLCFLTGHPQEWYYLTIVLVMLTLLRNPGKSRIEVCGWLKSSVRVLTLTAWSLLICALELVPDLLAVRPTMASTSADVGQVFFYNIQSSNLLQWLNPFALGGPDHYFGLGNYWETQLSVGLLPFLFVIIGIGPCWSMPKCRKWLFIGVGCLLFGAGPKLGLFSLFHAAVPGMDRFRVASRTLFLANLAWAVVSAIGFDSFFKIKHNRHFNKYLRKYLFSIFILLIVAGLFTLIASNIDRLESSRRLLRAWSVLVREPTYWWGVISGALILACPSRFRVAWIVALVASLELIGESHRLLRVSPSERFLNDDVSVHRLRERKAVGQDFYRLATIDSVISDLAAAKYGMEKTNVNDLFQNGRAAELYQTIYPFLERGHPPGWGSRPLDGAVLDHYGDIAKGVLDRMSVKWIITETPTHMSGIRLIEPIKDVSVKSAAIFINDNALPRAYVVPEAFTIDDELARPKTWLRNRDPRVFVALDVADPLPSGTRQPYRPAHYRSEQPDQVRVDVELDAPGFLVVTNTWDRGWSARLDGLPCEVLVGNRCQQVLAIRTPGRHRVELTFIPEGFWLGLGLSLVSILVWLGVGLQKIKSDYIKRVPTQTHP